MPFNIGLSGINAANADLRATGNNIANAGTVGFKSSRAEFADIYAASKNGVSNTQTGAGVRVNTVAQNFTQGNVSFTSSNMDLAISGDGFFNMKDAVGNTFYSRNGEFKVDQNGFIVSNDNSQLQGYQPHAQSNTTINYASTGAIQLTTSKIAPVASATGSITANIDSASTPIVATTVINPDDPTTYHHTTTQTTYDSLGNAMLTSYYFQKNDAATRGWTIGTRTVDASGVAVPADTAGPPIVKNTANFLVTFDTSGAVATIDDGAGVSGTGALYNNTGAAPTGTNALVIDLGIPTAANTPTGAAPQSLSMSLANLTQYGAQFAVSNITQDGYTTGDLSGIEFDQTGIVLARFTNGKSKVLGQLMLSNFRNPQGLSPNGGNNWTQSATSGQPVDNIPGSGAGLIQSGAVEESNVNLTEELIGLITAQRNFQANAKTITTANQVTQTILQI